MWSRDLSPNIFGSGLWSTAMVRFLHPRTKCLALSRASSTASASLSIGAYLDSAAYVNLLPTCTRLSSTTIAAKEVMGGAITFIDSFKHFEVHCSSEDRLLENCYREVL